MTGAAAIIVCGGRDYGDREHVDQVLDRVRERYPTLTVIAGAARGADTLAAEWATRRGVPLVEMPADWEQHGRGAGPLRNRAMLRALLDHAPGRIIGVVAFPGGSGTAHMVRIALDAGVHVFQPLPPGAAR